MTYCRAWKKEGYTFLITDTCLSQKNGECSDKLSSFGENMGIYGEYFVSENQVKIVKLKEDMVIAYSGTVDVVKEAVSNFSESIEFNSVEYALEQMVINYNNNEFELIVLYKDLIYHFTGNGYTKIDDYVEIGSGTNNKEFTDEINKYIDEGTSSLSLEGQCLIISKDEEFDADRYLVDILSYIQFNSINKNMISQGVGGAFSGLYLNDKIHWCKDLIYYIYENDVCDFKTISAISRYNTLFTYSDNNSVIRWYDNRIKLDSYNLVKQDKYKQSAIIKSLMYCFPDYAIFFSKKDNIISVMELNKWPHNNFLHMWIRRKKDETKYSFAVSPIFNFLGEYIQREEPNNLKLFNLRVEDVPSEDRLDLVGAECSNIDAVDWNVTYDFDLRLLRVGNDYVSSKFESINLTAKNYHDIMIIDYGYFYTKLKEKYYDYKFANIDLNEQLKFELLIERFEIDIDCKEFNEYGFYFIKRKSDKEYLDDFSVLNWIKCYNNCTIIEIEEQNERYEFASIVSQTLEHYYYDEIYFSIDKIILFCENIDVNSILNYVPLFNTEVNNPDIILIRNYNFDTKMNGKFRYIVADIAIAIMMGYNSDDIGLLESGFIPY